MGNNLIIVLKMSLTMPLRLSSVIPLKMLSFCLGIYLYFFVNFFELVQFLKFFLVIVLTIPSASLLNFHREVLREFLWSSLVALELFGNSLGNPLGLS